MSYGTSVFDNVIFNIVRWGKDPDTLTMALLPDPVAVGLVGHHYENMLGKEPEGVNVSDWDRTSKFSLFSKQIAIADDQLRDGRIIQVTHRRNPETRGWDLLAVPEVYKIDSSRRSLGTTRDKTLALSDYTTGVQ